MSEWKNKRLVDYWVFNPKIQVHKDEEYSFIEMPDLIPGNKHVYPKRKRKAKGLTKFQNGDTLFAKITPCLENGKICQAQGLEDNKGVGSTEFYVFRGKEGVSDNDFIHYLLKWYPIRKFAEKCMSGSAGHQRVPSDVFDGIELPFPDFKESVEIGKTLSNLDQKITLLREQNQTLEELAQTLFKRWFVEFEFPISTEQAAAMGNPGLAGQPYKSSGGKMVESELGEIPEAWRVGCLGDEFTILMGQSPAGSSYNVNKNGKIFYQGRTDFGFRFPTNRLYTTEPKRIAQKFDVLISVRAPVGDLNMASEECCIGRGLGAVKSNLKSYCFNTVLNKFF